MSHVLKWSFFWCVSISIAGAATDVRAALVTAERICFDIPADGPSLAPGLVADFDDQVPSGEMTSVQEPIVNASPDIDSAEAFDDPIARGAHDGVDAADNTIWVSPGASLTWVNLVYGPLTTVASSDTESGGPPPATAAVVPLPAAVWTGGMMLAALASVSTIRSRSRRQ